MFRTLLRWCKMVGAANSINLATAGIVGFTGTAFGATPVTQYNVLLGGASVSTIAQAAPAAAGTVLTSNGVAANPSFQAVSSFNPSTTLSLFDDFNSAIGNTSIGTLGWTTSGWQTPSAAQSDNHPGVIGNGAVGAINTPTYDFLSIATSNNAGTITLGNGVMTVEYLFNMRTLSNGTIRYTFRMGLGVTSTTADQTAGVYIEYSDNVNTGQWQYKTAQASTRTTNNSTIAVTTGWHKLVMTINAAASSVSFTMDGVSMGAAITTNIPLTPITPFFFMNGTVGNLTSDMIAVDYMNLNQTFTTPR